MRPTAMRWCLSLMAIMAAESSSAVERQVQVYDDGKYEGSELALVVKSPRAVPSPVYGARNQVSIPRSADNHYHVHGFVNGFPILFVVDSGASLTTIPLRYAKVSGIRAGMVEEVQTGGGVVKMGVSEQNRIGVGPVGVSGVKVAVSESIPIAVLGMNVLNHFKISVDEHGWMTLTLVK